MRRVVLAALGLSLTLSTPGVAKDCDRPCTLQVAEAVLAALQSGQPGKLLPRSLRLTENGRDIRVADSQLRAFRNLTYLHTFADPTGGQAGFNGAADAYGGPAVFAMRVKLKGGQVAEIETLVVRRTEAPVFAPQTMAGTPAWDQDLAPERRASRADMMAAVGAWLDGVSKPDIPAVAAAADCALSENGARSTQAAPCRNVVGLRGAAAIRDRRWAIIDEATGLIWVLAVADLPNGHGPVAGQTSGQSPRRVPRSVLTGALFRLEAGQVRDVELILRDAPLGATTGWAPPKAKKGS